MDDRIEAVARDYCRRMGLDPDEVEKATILYRDEADPRIFCWIENTTRPLWQRFAREAEDQIAKAAMQEAIAEVMAAPVNTPETAPPE